MKQVSFVTTKNSDEEVQNLNLTRILMILSAVCLLAAFYFNGTLNGNMLSSPQPSGRISQSGGILPLANKTSQSNTVIDVVTKALAFKALLSTSQQGTLEQAYTTTLARKWSNLPCGASCRNGIQFGVLTSAQLSAALELIRAATGTNASDGYDEFIQNRLAESYLHTNGGGNGYDSTLRWISFLNTPSATGGWMLQFGGHHYAANIAFNNGHVVGATPFFQGLEPVSFTMNSTTYAPLNDEHDALTAMLSSLSSAELTTAKLNSTFSDCTLVPGESNGGSGIFPAAKAGLICSSLTTLQKNLVLAAIEHYVQDADNATAAAVMAVYTSEIDQTYIAYTGNGTSGNASTFLNANSNYVRIDGPTVWIELSCQNGVVIQGQIHYHTIWRDHSHDYGVDLSGDAIDEASTSTGIAEVTTKGAVKIYPNPASDNISLSLNTTVTNAKMTLINAVTGQTIASKVNVNGTNIQYDVSTLPVGLYILRIEDGTKLFTGKFNKL